MPSSVCGRAYGFQSTRPRGARHVAAVLDRGDALVSIHAPARGATTSGHRCAAPGPGFNPRAREGRDLELVLGGRLQRVVSIHAPARGATRERLVCVRRSPVSIHAPARGATCIASATFAGLPRFQSTRPRGARPQSLGVCHEQRNVSIHAPARGATGGCATAQETTLVVSIHAPARGATRSRLPPDARAGEVSIHAPARGATRRASLAANARASFNPRAREGRDIACRPALRPSVMFQSTRPRGARPIRPSRWTWRRHGFNPRAREGRDIERSGSFYLANAFQSTRPRGARRANPDVANAACGVSIHAPARGATGTPDASGCQPSAFQSTRPRGARPQVRRGRE